jgi:hypothetical protein
MARFAQISRGAPTALRMINFAAAVYAVAMSDNIKSAVPVLPAVDVAESLEWWTARCGFTEAFRDNTPPNYAGISGGDAHLHLAGMNDAKLARIVGDQTMVRIRVEEEERCTPNTNSAAESCIRTGRCKPSRGERRSWSDRSTGVCVTFFS